jgi:hypothetical protein
MMNASQTLKKAVLQRTDEIDTDGYHQTIMNIMYEKWQTESAMSYNDILNWFETTYGSLAKFAVLIGKYNQQVCNGGHIQYFHNGYADGKGGFMSDHDPSIPLHKELIKLFMKTNLDDDISQQVLRILKCFEIELDEEEELEDLSYLSTLDSRSYQINDAFMNILERYFESKIMEQFNEDH